MSSAPYGIYARVSEVGDRNGESFASPEEQEVSARAWAEREGVEVYFNEDECVELDVSGAVAAEERKLGRLIERCETGELAGIIVRDERRFARDPIAGGVALDRLVECGARLKATWSGFDSANLTPESRMVFDIMMAIGKAERARNRSARVSGSRRAAKNGYYLASKAPLGYTWSERRTRSDGSPGAGKLVPDQKTARLVQQVFRRRAAGESHSSLAAWLREQGVQISKSGVRVIVQNRAYVGEATVPTERKGQVETVTSAHKPLVTQEEFERAQAAASSYQPRNGRWASQAQLRGLVYCSGCGRRLSVAGGGKRGNVAYYACTAEGCTSRVGIRMERLDAYVRELLSDALLNREPHVAAVMEGDDRYQRGLDAVEEARVELETYRAAIKVSDVGAEPWKRDVATRQAALDLARKGLRSIPSPAPVKIKSTGPVTFEEALPELNRAFVARFVDRIVVHRIGRGRRVPVGERADVYWIGSEEPATPLPMMEPLTHDDLAKLAQPFQNAGPHSRS